MQNIKGSDVNVLLTRCGLLGENALQVVVVDWQKAFMQECSLGHCCIVEKNIKLVFLTLSVCHRYSYSYYDTDSILYARFK